MILVMLDRLDRLNPAGWFEFPTLAAAERFAAAARRRHPGRAVVVLPRDGVQELNTDHLDEIPTEIGDLL